MHDLLHITELLVTYTIYKQQIHMTETSHSPIPLSVDMRFLVVWSRALQLQQYKIHYTRYTIYTLYATKQNIYIEHRYIVDTQVDHNLLRFCFWNLAARILIFGTSFTHRHVTIPRTLCFPLGVLFLCRPHQHRVVFPQPSAKVHRYLPLTIAPVRSGTCVAFDGLPFTC